MEKLIVSACLLGKNCKYNGKNNYVDKIELLKDGSPSCGSSMIYDGTFSKTKIKGMGITAKLFNDNSIIIFNENEIEKLLDVIL